QGPQNMTMMDSTAEHTFVDSQSRTTMVVMRYISRPQPSVRVCDGHWEAKHNWRGSTGSIATPTWAKKVVRRSRNPLHTPK
ncbi:hypothetical protein L195_g047646, partial [Trifolium pratense]